MPHAWHLFAVRGQDWGSEGDKFSLEIFRNNFPVNSIFYWGNQRFPVLFTVLAWIGLASFAPFRKKLPLALWFALFWGVFLFFLFLLIDNRQLTIDKGIRTTFCQLPIVNCQLFLYCQLFYFSVNYICLINIKSNHP